MIFNQMKAGDLIQTKHKLIGELVAVDEKTVEVYFLVPDKTKANGKIWVYKEDWDLIEKSDIIKHIEIKDKRKYPSYYREMGFKAWDGEIFTRTDVDIESDEDLKRYPFPTGCDTDDDDAQEYEYDGFVVEDKEDEPFSQADPANKEVQEFHQAVHDYNNWCPKDASEERAKSFVDEMEKKYSSKDDNYQFKQGKSIDYNHPPLPKKQKTAENPEKTNK